MLRSPRIVAVLVDDTLKWSGLGMGLFSTTDTDVFDGYVDELLAEEFGFLRVDIPNYQDSTWLARSKAAVIRAIAKGAEVIWGVSSNPGGDVSYCITTENWPTFRQAILDAAQWAQDNGVYEFQLGNEEEWHVYRYPASITRTSNVATVTFAEDHAFTADNPINIWYGVPTDFNSYGGTITVTGAKTFTYPSTGDDGSVSNPSACAISNISEGTIQTNLKSVATSAQAIFTRGKISYTAGFGAGTWVYDLWDTLGLGDIDLLGWNAYYSWDGTLTNITNAVSTWGSRTYITEFGLNPSGIDLYSSDETVQASTINLLLNHIISSGIERAHYFNYISDDFGAKKNDGTYRELWSVLIGDL